MNHCQKKCCGGEGQAGGCCKSHNGEWMIGPIPDHIEVLGRVRRQFKGIEIKWKDIFIDYEEGKNLFPDRPSWQKPENYPIMRIRLDIKDRPCIFYNDHINCCQIYKSKSITCSNYKCDYLKQLEEDLK
jgi:Fe-S-cluster containining protein